MTVYELPKDLVHTLAAMRALDPAGFDQAASEFAEEAARPKEPKVSKPVPTPEAPKAPKAASEPTLPTPRRTPSEVRQDIERLLGANARRLADKRGLDFYTAYNRYLGTAHGQELLRLHIE